MPTGQVTTVLHHLRRLVGPGHSLDASDADLLRRFVTGRDEESLAALVRRHAPLVWNVCQRVLPHTHDAEDAFQATFLVLVRKAHAIGRPEQLSNWLYGVAQRTALKARVMNAKRTATALHAVETATHGSTADTGWQDLRPLLDAELGRLPDKYRVPVVLCYLEGKTHEQAAVQLGWPIGTVAGRLARARELLRSRLTRRGAALSASLVSVFLTNHAASAAVPPALVTSTIQAAAGVAAGQAATLAFSAQVATLAEGVLRAMCISNLKAVCFAGCLAAVLGLGVACLSGSAAADKPAKQGKATGGNAALVKQKKELGPTVRGTLKSADATKNIVHISIPVPGTKQSEEKSFELAKDVKVYLEDVVAKTPMLPEGKVSDLIEGTHVALTQSADKKNVVEIHARGPSFHGRINAVNAAGSTLTIGSKDQTGPTEKSFTFAPGAKVLLNDGLSKGTADQEGKIADLTEGTHVLLQLTVDQKSALSLRVHGRSFRGTLKSHDAANNTITITVKGENGLEDKTFKVSKDAQLLDLTEGSPVNLRMSVFDKETVIAAQGLKQ